MRLVAIGIVCGLLAFQASEAAAQKPAPVPLTIPQGALAGTQEDGILVFKGIPFAAPPVGPLRWRAPQGAPGWQGVRDAADFGPICPQRQPPALQRLFSSAIPQSEDCLSLNVWTTDVHAKLPVMVWIYGGAFVGGGSAYPIYDGTDLARHGVVIVTFNYRLGWLGTFNHPALAAEAPDEPHGNYGLMDQIAALEWVQKNIAAFGGDPANVTIFGESAGGMSVNDLMASPRARGLFAKAISESGLGLIDMPTASSAETAAKEFAVRNGAVRANPLAELRALSTQQILDDQARLLGVGLVSPMVDGVIIPEETDIAFAHGRIAPVPYIAGSNSNESTLMSAMHMNPADMLKPLGDRAAAVRKIYETDGPLTDDAFGRQLYDDALFAAGAQALPDFAARTGRPAYDYQFAYVAEPLRPTTSGVGHGGEIPFVFGLRGLGPEYAGKATPADLAVVAEIQAYWTNFAKTGDPNGVDLPQWQTTSAAMPQTLIVGDDGTKTVDGFRKNQIALMYANWSRRTGMAPPNESLCCSK